jgi:hypothetical protein
MERNIIMVRIRLILAVTPMHQQLVHRHTQSGAGRIVTATALPTEVIPEPLNPCVPGTGTPDPTNAIWAAADCDNDGETNGFEHNNGTDPSDSRATTRMHLQLAVLYGTVGRPWTATATV